METKIIIVTILALLAVGVLLFQILQIAGLNQQLQNSAAGTTTGSVTASAGSGSTASSGTGQSTGSSQPSMVGGC